MKKFSVLAVFLLACQILCACTTFVLKDGDRVYFARNYDFSTGLGFISYNPAGLQKQALIPNFPNPARWTALYNSVTFNQIGIDAPMGGMNDAGLIVTQMALNASRYPAIDGRPAVNQLEWIQFQLDNYASIEEMLENPDSIQVISVTVPVHYYCCDKDGKRAVVEFMDGEMVIYTGEDLNLIACGNIPYKYSEDELAKYTILGGKESVPENWASLEDIVAMAHAGAMAPEKGKALETAFKTMEKVGTPQRTQWSAVFDPQKLNIHFRTRENRDISVVNLKKLARRFKNEAPVGLFLDDYESSRKLHKQFSGMDESDYLNYRKALMGWYFKNIPGFPNMPEAVLKQESAYIYNRKMIR